MIRYSLTKKHHGQRDSRRVSYGIAAYTEQSSAPIAELCDLSDDRESLSRLVDHCNQADLSIAHLRDVVEDFLCF